ncbi:MAG: hypothetical protein KGO83_03885, partial [Paenibacillaceae bacterium]|nr:hypothetical protein [Paenibacillaceae bacterium]
DGVVLQNVHIAGTLTISEKVGTGTVTLNNLIVDQRVVVRGGGKESVYFNGGTYKEGVVIGNTPGGQVRIVAKAETALPIVIEQAASNQTVILDGKLSTVVADGKENKIVANPKTEIESIQVHETAQQTVIKNEKEAVIKEIKTDAVVKIENNGMISKAIEGTKATETTEQLVGTKPTEKPIEQPVAEIVPISPSSGGSGTPPVNNAPTNIALSASAIAENAGNNATVGTLSGVDADAGSTFAYSLVTGTGDTDNGAFAVSGATVQANSSFDFETKASYTIRVRVTDNGGLTYEKAFAITVTDVNEAPTNIALSSDTIAASATGNDVAVGILSGVDADAGSTFTYSLVTGTGDTDNGSFTISGNSLRTAQAIAAGTYSIRVRVVDQDAAVFEKVLTIVVSE